MQISKQELAAETVLWKIATGHGYVVLRHEPTELAEFCELIPQLIECMEISSRNEPLLRSRFETTRAIIHSRAAAAAVAEVLSMNSAP